MKYILLAILHEHEFGVTSYTAVIKEGECFDLQKFIIKNYINFEADKDEFINYHPLGLPEGFEIARTGEQDQTIVDELTKLFDPENDKHIFELDSMVHDLYSNAASKINNDGIQEQIKHIVFKLGADRAKTNILKFIQESPATTPSP